MILVAQHMSGFLTLTCKLRSFPFLHIKNVIWGPISTSNASIEWNYTGSKPPNFRAWYFTSSDGKFDQELLGQIYGDQKVIDLTREFDIEIVKPSTLILKNINMTYNGTYRFGRLPGDNSDVVVFIAGKFYM